MRAPSAAGDRVRAGVRGLGEVLITFGLVLLLFVVYQLVWTNVEANRQQVRVSDQIREVWQRPPSQPAVGPSKVDPGKGFAFIRIPRLGRDYAVPILEGVGLDVLARGVGHYRKTAMPGELGNFALAGHRATNGEPFARLDKVKRNDLVYIETATTWFTYQIEDIRIVAPTAVWVIDPVPGQPDAKPRESLITLTTCNPRWASYERLILRGRLVAERAKSQGPPPELIGRV